MPKMRKKRHRPSCYEDRHLSSPMNKRGTYCSCTTRIIIVNTFRGCICLRIMRERERERERERRDTVGWPLGASFSPFSTSSECDFFLVLISPHHKDVTFHQRTSHSIKGLQIPSKDVTFHQRTSHSTQRLYIPSFSIEGGMTDAHLVRVIFLFYEPILQRMCIQSNSVYAFH